MDQAKSNLSRSKNHGSSQIMSCNSFIDHSKLDNYNESNEGYLTFSNYDSPKISCHANTHYKFDCELNRDIENNAVLPLDTCRKLTRRSEDRGVLIGEQLRSQLEVSVSVTFLA